MPQNLVALIEACLAGESVQSLVDIILQDAGLSARVLNAASKGGSVELAGTEPVTSAVQQLGISVLTGVALQAAKQVVACDFSAEELNYQSRLWFSSRVSGQLARCLAPTVSYLHVEEAQLCGLFLNLGMHLMFSRYGEEYAERAVEPYSSDALCQREHEHYRTDHLKQAELLIEPWKLDSFLVDAIRYLHIDVAQVENSCQLIRIARLAQQLSQHPNELTEESVSLAERLLQFRQSEIEYLFNWAHGLYKPHAPALDDPQRLLAELKKVRGRLIDLIFALADQEGARARLVGHNRPEDLVSEARDLYLENSPATEAVFLLVDQHGNQLVGVSAQGQPRLINDLKIPLDATLSLVVQALIGGEANSSFDVEQSLTVTDRLVLRACGSKEFCCHPFRLDDRLLGVVVLGINCEADLSSVQSLRLRMFSQVVSDALTRVSSDDNRFVEGAGLLRRVSHELSNPLTIISNYAEVLNQLLTEKDQREMPEAIKREVRRIDDVLNYYSNQQELPPFPDQNININQLVHEAVDALQESDLQPRQIDVRFNLKNDLDRINTNGVLVKQVLVNLLKNAAEAVGKGGEISLQTRDSYCSDGQKYTEVVVQDNGTGIDEQVLDKLFRPVVSTKGPGHSGVGLSIVKGMVDDLGGRISYHSSTGSGTGFHLQLPCNRENSAVSDHA